MRDLFLMLVFAWQTITAPFFPDPAVEIKVAQRWLKQNVHRDMRLTPELIRSANAAGFTACEVRADAFRQLRDALPLKGVAMTHLYVVSKTIPSRLAWTVTDVIAYLALDSDNRIVAVETRTHRTSL